MSRSQKKVGMIESKVKWIACVLPKNVNSHVEQFMLIFWMNRCLGVYQELFLNTHGLSKWPFIPYFRHTHQLTMVNHKESSKPLKKIPLSHHVKYWIGFPNNIIISKKQVGITTISYPRVCVMAQLTIGEPQLSTIKQLSFGWETRNSSSVLTIWKFPETRGTPSYHPFLFGIFHYKPYLLGYPLDLGNPHWRGK